MNILALAMILCSPSYAATAVQTQDIGTSSISWSGTTVFNGVVAVSSITGDLDGKSVVQNASQFIIAVATVSFSVTGKNPLKVCFSGSLLTAGSGPLALWSFMVDGAYIENLSASKGAHWSNGLCNGCDQDISSCYPIKAGVIAAGTHNFCFIPSAGLGNTATVGNGKTEAKFWVEEQH